MITHIRNVRVLSGLFGVALAAWAVWCLMTQIHSKPVVTSWLVVLAFACLLIAVCVTLGRTRFLGKVLLGVVSIVFVLYALAWLLLGGVDDAGNYWPALALGIAFFGYANYVSYKHSAGQHCVERS